MLSWSILILDILFVCLDKQSAFKLKTPHEYQNQIEVLVGFWFKFFSLKILIENLKFFVLFASDKYFPWQTLGAEYCQNTNTNELWISLNSNSVLHM